MRRSSMLGVNLCFNSQSKIYQLLPYLFLKPKVMLTVYVLKVLIFLVWIISPKTYMKLFSCHQDPLKQTWRLEDHQHFCYPIIDGILYMQFREEAQLF